MDGMDAREGMSDRGDMDRDRGDGRDDIGDFGRHPGGDPGGDPSGDPGGDPEDVRFAAILRRAARDYNPPPETPRERMWGRIEERVRASRRPPHPTWSAGLPRRTRVARAVAAAPPWAWGIGMAALLVVGIGIGRISVENVGTGAAPAGRLAAGGSPDTAGRAPAEGPAVGGPAIPGDPSRIDTEAGVRRETDPADDADAGVAAPPPGEGAGVVAEAPRRDAPGAARPVGEDPGAAVDRPTPERAIPEPPAPERGATERGAPTAGERARVAEAGGPYRRFTSEHLGQTEALLTAFRLGEEGGAAPSEVRAWADALLSETRLLLDSRAAREPRLRGLLEEMELVLAEIIALGDEGDAADRAQILRALDNANLLLRLRSAAGSRPDRGGAAEQRTSL